MGLLEEKSLWLKYKTEVWDEDTPETAAVHNIMRVLRSIRNSGDLIYVSVPITSGKILYDTLLEHPNKTKKELLNEVINANYNIGWSLVEEIKKRENKLVLYPADLVPARQKWKDKHFQALWLSILGEKCTELHMTDNWWFSNGAAEEFTHVFQLKLGLPKSRLAFYNTKEDFNSELERMRNIQVYDHTGKLISLNDGIIAIDKSLEWITNQGFETKRLKECRELLEWTGDMIDKGFYQ